MSGEPVGGDVLEDDLRPGAHDGQRLQGSAERGRGFLPVPFPASIPGAGQADTCVVVSDGRMTLDGWDATPPPCRTFALSSAKGADRNFLAALAERGGGRHVDLSSVTPDAALARLTAAGTPGFSLKADDGQAGTHEENDTQSPSAHEAHVFARGGRVSTLRTRLIEALQYHLQSFA